MKLCLLPHWLSKKPLRAVFCPLKTHLILFLALAALFGFCIVNQTSCSESFVTLQWRHVSTLIRKLSFLLVSGSLLLESERGFWKQCLLRSHSIYLYDNNLGLLTLSLTARNSKVFFHVDINNCPWLLIGLNLYKIMRINQKCSHFWVPCWILAALRPSLISI